MSITYKCKNVRKMSFANTRPTDTSRVITIKKLLLAISVENPHFHNYMDKLHIITLHNVTH